MMTTTMTHKPRTKTLKEEEPLFRTMTGERVHLLLVEKVQKQMVMKDQMWIRRLISSLLRELSQSRGVEGVQETLQGNNIEDGYISYPSIYYIS